MEIDKVFQDQLIKITQEAAISVYPHLGKNNKIIADEAATNSMRTNLNKMNIRGKIVIGEGEMDEAPMLYIGEKVGTEKGPELDIAVDPLEGTNFAAKSLPGAISVIAISNKDNLFNAPESYMEKISFPHGIDKSAIDLDFSLKKYLFALLSDIFFLIHSTISLEFCLATTIFEFSKEEVFSKIILSIVLSFSGSQSK